MAWIQYQTAHPKLISYTTPCKLACRLPPKVATKSWIQYQRPFPQNLRRIFVATLNQGRQEPVKVEQRGARVGLGSDGPAASVESRKNAIWLKTQKRFNNSQVLEAFNETESDDDNHNNKSSS